MILSNRILPTISINLTPQLEDWDLPQLENAEVDHYFLVRFRADVYTRFKHKFNVEVTRSADIEKFVTVEPPVAPWDLIRLRAIIGCILEDLFQEVAWASPETIKEVAAGRSSQQ